MNLRVSFRTSNADVAKNINNNLMHLKMIRAHSRIEFGGDFD